MSASALKAVVKRAALNRPKYDTEQLSTSAQKRILKPNQILLQLCHAPRKPRPMNGLLYVALGGALGASARHLLGEGAKRAFGPDYPYGTLCANILGGFFMGLLAGWLAYKISGSENIRLFLGVGLLGGFTTFSSFSLEAFSMLERKAYGTFAGYISMSVIISIAALAVGLMLARKMFGT